VLVHSLYRAHRAGVPATAWHLVLSYQLYRCAFVTITRVSIGGSMLGPGGTGPQILPSPQFLIGSIVISLSRCCLPNDEGPPPPNIFFLEPPLRVSQPQGWKT